MKSLLFSLIVFFNLSNLLAKDIIAIDVTKLGEEKNIESTLFGLEVKNHIKKDILNGKYNAEFKLINIDEVNKKNKHFWIAFQLTNTSLKKIDLLIGTTKFDFINFYIGDTIKGYELTKGGLLCKNNERKIISGPASFAEIVIEPQKSKLVFLEVKNIRSPDFDYSPVPLQLFEASSFHEHEGNNQKFMYFVLGAILLMALYNFFIFWIVKDNAYLYYVGYNLSFCSFILITEGGFIQKYFENSYYQFTAVNHTGSIILIFYILFAKKMLNIKLWYPKIDLALNIIFISYFFSELCTILEFNSIATILNFLLSSVTLNIIAIAAGLIYFKKHYLPAKYFFSALLFYFTGAIIMIMQMLHILPNRILGLGWSEFLQTGEVMQLTFFSLSLASRFAVIRQQLAKEELEKERILRQKDAELKAILEKENQILENKFQARSRELEASQSRLIQQEKLASLGQLTAGIAHEIKNPLNFVTNFSEIGKELLDDFMQSKNNDERTTISNDLKGVLSKINEHGKRADSIVKSMLEHSRSTKGELTLTDINKLCDEYLNLSYHGMRANNVNFNCEVVRNFADNLPQIMVVREDLSRVILNLLNNAFYEVNERSKYENNYQPKVEVSTYIQNNYLYIKIWDNGKGIPDDIIAKIFEPFYTTKPTGVGTGLGLSLSYDIVKSHGGDLKVTSKLMQFTEFTINLEL
jgi:two-component system NtrC family sensor kinase